MYCATQETMQPSHMIFDSSQLLLTTHMAFGGIPLSSIACTTTITTKEYEAKYILSLGGFSFMARWPPCACEHVFAFCDSLQNTYIAHDAEHIQLTTIDSISEGLYIFHLRIHHPPFPRASSSSLMLPRLLHSMLFFSGS